MLPGDEVVEGMKNKNRERSFRHYERTVMMACEVIMSLADFADFAREFYSFFLLM